MKKQLIVNAPLNQLSFGNVSVNILREMWKRDMNISLFPIGEQAELSAFDKLPKDFVDWLSKSIDGRFSQIDKDVPCLKLWHINGSENRISERQFLLTFHELNSVTPIESSIVNLQNATLFSSQFSKDNFSQVGCKNVHSVKLGFDEDFYRTEKKYLKDKIVFGISGKLEKRKHTAKIIKLWIKKYGGNFDYRLHCLVNNPFYKEGELQLVYNEILDNKNVGNVTFYRPQATNTLMNSWLNSIDIDLSGLSGAEGWNLGAFNSTCLGKHSIVLDHTSHKEWATENNSILIKPNGTEPAADGRFFSSGGPFNQGNIFTFSDDDALEAMERAEKVAKDVNEEGIKLGKDLTYSKTLDSIMEIVK